MGWGADRNSGTENFPATSLNHLTNLPVVDPHTETAKLLGNNCPGSTVCSNRWTFVFETQQPGVPLQQVHVGRNGSGERRPN